MLKTLDKKNREKGSVTIEATIALTAFLFMFIMIYSIITICRAQAQIQVAINATAKEISQYSYIYGLTGLDQSLAKFQGDAQDQKDEINNAVGDIADVFEGIQSLGDSAQNIDVGNIDSALEKWDEVSTELDNLNEDYSEAKKTIESMASNPQNLLLGMAKLIGSESLELAKSRAIAEPVCRSLIQKHLKRSNNDTAENFCKSIGIIPGTYFGTSSHFNGLDFSNSTLFPYGSDEITIIVTYKVKLLQLLPVDLEFTITQSAVTRGWLHGDMSSSGNSAEEKVTALTKDGESLWNNATSSERNSLIRSMGVDQLKTEGYNGVSGENYIHAYNQTSKTYVMIRSSNPLAGVSSMDDIDKSYIKKELQNYATQITSSTDNKTYIKIKKKDVNGNLVTEKVAIEGEQTKKVIVVIPEDEGLKTIFEQVASELNSDVVFEFQQSYGKVFETNKKAEEGGTE